MVLRPITIWCTLFVLLATAAEGTAYVQIDEPGGNSAVCRAQSLIASLNAIGSESSPSEHVVCDIQRALAEHEDSSLPLGQDHSLLAALVLSQSANPIPVPLIAECSLIVSACARFQFLSTSSQIRIPPCPGKPPASRLSFQISPHAPPFTA